MLVGFYNLDYLYQNNLYPLHKTILIEMKKSSLLFLFFIAYNFVTSAQNKKIDFFGTSLKVDDACEIKKSSIAYNKNVFAWLDAPPESFREMAVAQIAEKFTAKNNTEIKITDLKVGLLKKTWVGKMHQYKNEHNDSITNFAVLVGKYKDEERMLMFIYKTLKLEKFRIPGKFAFLTKQ